MSKKNSRPFVIGESQDEILYHNFVYGSLSGADPAFGGKNVKAVSHGVDCGNIAVYAEGDAQAVLIDPQLVNLPGEERNYVLTSGDFSGSFRP